MHAFEVKKYIPVVFSSSWSGVELRVGILFPHINDDARSKSHQIYNTHFKNFRHNDKFHRHNSYYSTLDTYEPGNTGNIKDKVVPVPAMNAYRGGDKQHESFLMSALD